MPLKLTKRGQTYYVRGTVHGQNVYESTQTSDPGLAKLYLDKKHTEVWNHRVFGPSATVNLMAATVSYMDSRPPSLGYMRVLQRLLNHFCPGWQEGSGTGPLLADIDQATVDDACLRMLKPGAKGASRLRHVITPLTAILNHAAKRGWCAKPSFDRPKVSGRRIRWLFWPDALRLIDCAAPHLKPITTFMFMAGARCSEALGLDWTDVDLTAGVAVLRDTKNGHDRTVALIPDVVAALGSLEGRTGPVFRRPDGKPYAVKIASGGQFKRAWGTACKRAKIKNFTPHDCRHHWATWYYHETHDILQLKARGGWQNLNMVEVYTHVLPPHTPITVSLVAVRNCAPSVQTGRAVS